MQGRLNIEESEGSSPGEVTKEFKEASFDFPLVLLDIDESISKFKSVMGDKANNKGLEGEAGFYLS